MHEELVVVDINGTRALVSLASVGDETTDELEHEVGPRPPYELNSALSASFAVAKMALEAMSDIRWSNAKISLGIEFALESGALVAIIGKASAKSTIAIELGFTRDGRADD